MRNGTRSQRYYKSFIKSLMKSIKKTSTKTKSREYTPPPSEAPAIRKNSLFENNVSRAVYNMCISKNSDEMEEQLYVQYGNLFTNYLNSNVVFLVDKLEGKALLLEIEKR